MDAPWWNGDDNRDDLGDAPPDVDAFWRNYQQAVKDGAAYAWLADHAHEDGFPRALSVEFARLRADRVRRAHQQGRVA